MPSPRFDRSPETDVLVNFIVSMPESELIPYDRIGATIGMDVRRGRGRGLLVAARRIAEHEHRVFLRAGQAADGARGLYRCSPADFVGYGSFILQDFRRKAKVRIKRLSFADYERLTPEERRKLGTAATIAGVVAMASSRKAQAVVEGALTGAEKERLTATQTLQRLLSHASEIG